MQDRWTHACMSEAEKADGKHSKQTANTPGKSLPGRHLQRKERQGVRCEKQVEGKRKADLMRTSPRLFPHPHEMIISSHAMQPLLTVHPQVAAVRKGVAVGLTDRHARVGSTHVGKDGGGGDLGCQSGEVLCDSQSVYVEKRVTSFLIVQQAREQIEPVRTWLFHAGVIEVKTQGQGSCTRRSCSLGNHLRRMQ